MKPAKFFVVLVKDGPLRSCSRILMEDGTPLRGVSSYRAVRDVNGGRLVLEFNSAEIIRVDDVPPTGQSEFYSPTFTPGLKPERRG